jgi:hypothetical protein
MFPRYNFIAATVTLGLSKWSRHPLDVKKIIIKNINHQQNAQRVLSSIVTHSYMFRPCWVIFRKNFCYRYTKVALYSWVRMFCVLWTLCSASRDHREFTPPVHSTQSTAHSHSTTKCNLSVTITKVLPEDDPEGSKHVGVCYNWW